MKTALVATSIVFTTLTAFAGKEERDIMSKEVMPAVHDAEAKVKGSCGCALQITVDESTIKTKDDLYQAKNIAGFVAEGVATYCTDVASKKAVCQMKALTLAKTTKATFTFKGGKGVATTDGQSSCSWDMITRELDK
jgi:hypothetical protein